MRTKIVAKDYKKQTDYLKSVINSSKKHADSIRIKKEGLLLFPKFLCDIIVKNYKDDNFVEIYNNSVLDAYNEDKIQLDDMESFMKAMYEAQQ